MSIVVRRAVAADAEALSALNAEVQAIHAKALPWLFKAPGSDTFSPSAVEALLGEADSLIFVAELHGIAAGYAVAQVVRRPETPFHFAHDMLYVNHFGVRAAARRQGVGSALMAAVRAAATQCGVATVALDVWSFNERARAFFCRRGLSTYNERLWNR
jgi:ribosomal protein S18 acetylase RimI-like enzyme